MKLTQRISLGLMICAPVLVLGMVNLSPRPKALSEAWDKVQLYESHQQGWRAVPHLRLILEYLPERVELWERMAANEFAAGNYPQAVEAYRAASEIRMLSTIGLDNLGEACLQSGDPNCAKDAWLQAIERDDIAVETLSKLTDTLRTMGELEGALQAAARWREMEPDSTHAAWLTGLLLTPNSPEDALPHLVDASGVKALKLLRRVNCSRLLAKLEPIPTRLTGWSSSVSSWRFWGSGMWPGKPCCGLWPSIRITRKPGHCLVKSVSSLARMAGMTFYVPKLSTPNPRS
jgi:tetratricopeptide (TPR) repeat protein